MYTVSSVMMNGNNGTAEVFNGDTFVGYVEFIRDGSKIDVETLGDYNHAIGVAIADRLIVLFGSVEAAY